LVNSIYVPLSQSRLGVHMGVISSVHQPGYARTFSFSELRFQTLSGLKDVNAGDPSLWFPGRPTDMSPKLFTWSVPSVEYYTERTPKYIRVFIVESSWLASIG
jgi:hypothetical protein